MYGTGTSGLPRRRLRLPSMVTTRKNQKRQVGTLDFFSSSASAFGDFCFFGLVDRFPMTVGTPAELLPQPHSTQFYHHA